jgi:dolichyl-phosphate-mannose--protein O-mannosyl transferase
MFKEVKNFFHFITIYNHAFSHLSNAIFPFLCYLFCLKKETSELEKGISEDKTCTSEVEISISNDKISISETKNCI